MTILLFAVALACGAFAVHLVMWRVRIPRRQTRALLAIFAAVPVVVLCLGAVFRQRLPTWWPENAWEWLHIMGFYSSVLLGYIVVYTAVEERSPSMTLLSYVSQAPSTGRTRQELEAVLGRASPVEVRLDALVRDNMIEAHDEDCVLTDKGRQWAAAFAGLRRWLGFGAGG